MTPTQPPNAFAGNIMDQNFVREEQPTFDAQRGQTPLVQQVEPSQPPNPFVGMQNDISQQQVNDAPQQIVQQQPTEFLQQPQPSPFYRPPGAMQVPPAVGYQRSFADLPRPPPEAGPQFPVQPIFPMMPPPLPPQLPPQFPPQLPHQLPPQLPPRMPPQFPPQMPPQLFPRLPQMPPVFPQQPPFYPLMFPPMQPPPGMGYPYEDNNDDDRPSVNVSVETSRSKIVSSKTAKKT